MNVFENIINTIIDGLVAAVNAILSILPDSPFAAPIEMISATVGSEILGYVNYFIPISEMVAILFTWLGAILIYYSVTIVMRWAKAIS
jgi:hypothetical protein